MSPDSDQESFFVALGTNPADRLSDPEVRKFFLGILGSELPPEKKYDKFLEFFRLDSQLSRTLLSHAHELEGRDEEMMQQVLATAAEDAGLWNPGEILGKTEDCLRRAVRRLRNSQHRDGGWGFQIEVSSVWGTVYSTLSLSRAEEQGLATPGTREAWQRGIDWLLARRDHWSVESIPPEEERSIYELGLVIRCLCETRQGQDPEIRRLIGVCVDRLAADQNGDGGWDRSIWGARWKGPTRTWSEVGATSFALQALAAAGSRGSASAIRKGIDCLAQAQNEDGSWNIMISRELLNRGERSVTKTCDALKGILAGRKAGVDLDPYRERISRAFDWLQHREQPMFNSARDAITGWGWHSDEISTIENTCHTLETLLQVEDASLPLLTSNASWLMQCQFLMPGSLEDGKWAHNDTGRITLSLLELHKAIQASPLFSSVSAAAAASVAYG